MLLFKYTKLNFEQTEQMKVNIRKQNSGQIKEYSEKYVIGLKQFKEYEGLIARFLWLLRKRQEQQGV